MGDKSPKPSNEYSQSTQDVWGPQADALKKLYGAGEDWFSQNNPGIQDAANQAANTSQQALNAAAPVWNQGLQGGNLAGYDIAGGLAGSLGNAMGQQTQQQQAVNGMQGFDAGQGFDQGDIFRREGGSNYADAYKQNFVNDARSAMETSLAAVDSRAAASGMSGGSRHGTAMAKGIGDINSNLQSNLANIGYQDFNNRQDQRFQDRTNRQNRDFQDYSTMQGMGFQDQSRMQGMQQQAAGAADQNLMQQQQMMQQLIGQQQGSAENALGMQEQVQGYTSAQLQNMLNSSGGLQVMQGLLGNLTPLTEQRSVANGGISGGGVSGNIGTSGANLSF